VRRAEWVRPDAHTTVGAPVPAHLPHRSVLSLRQRNLDALQRRFDAVSDPAHDAYGRHMSHDDVRAMIAPRDDDVLELQHYLLRHGATACELTRTGDAMTVTMPVAAVNAVFGVEMQTFRRTYHTERHIVRSARAHTLPADTPLSRRCCAPCDSTCMARSSWESRFKRARLLAVMVLLRFRLGVTWSTDLVPSWARI
jgi:hypothetical protein